MALPVGIASASECGAPSIDGDAEYDREMQDFFNDVDEPESGGC